MVNCGVLFKVLYICITIHYEERFGVPYVDLTSFIELNNPS